MTPTKKETDKTFRGRFAPSPTGRMHLGNMLSALSSWLSVKSKGGKWVLRIEDLDPQRSRLEWAQWIEDDLHWLGLDWDAGGLDHSRNAAGEPGAFSQSTRSGIYMKALEILQQAAITYRCRCRRADILATQAPHESDGRIVYGGTCRPERLGGPRGNEDFQEGALRLWVPDKEFLFTDMNYGPQSVNLARHCGDYIVRRADGAWAYQLAVVADDRDMGITEVVRGSDLLLSSAQQIYLNGCLESSAPAFGHVPLLCNREGRRLSKRDSSLSMEELRKKCRPENICGLLGWLLNLIPEPDAVTPNQLVALFDWQKIPKDMTIRLDGNLKI